MYGIDLPHVSSIPGVKLTRSKNYYATLETKIKFEIYGYRVFGPRKHVAMAEKSIQDILDARDGDGGKRSSNESKAIS